MLLPPVVALITLLFYHKTLLGSVVFYEYRGVQPEVRDFRPAPGNPARPGPGIGRQIRLADLKMEVGGEGVIGTPAHGADGLAAVHPLAPIYPAFLQVGVLGPDKIGGREGMLDQDHIAQSGVPAGK